MDGNCKGLATYWTMNRKYLVPHLGLSREWTFHLAVNFPLVELSRLSCCLISSPTRVFPMMQRDRFHSYHRFDKNTALLNGS